MSRHTPPTRTHTIRHRLHAELRRWARGLSPDGLMYVQKLSDYRIAGGNRVGVLIDGTIAIPEMIAAVRKAKSRVLYEAYIHRNDEIGREFVSALREAALRGVAVYLNYDDWGCDDSRDLLDGLADVGVHVHAFHPVTLFTKFSYGNARNHRKILVVDNEVGFTGGVNVGEEYYGTPSRPPFRDTHLKIEGPALHQLTLSFFKCWFEQTGIQMEPGEAPHAIEGSATKVLITTETLRRERSSLRRSYIFAFKAARERLLITNSYFVPDAQIREAIKGAARRGVQVRIIVPTITDVPLARFAGWAIYPEMLAAGVELFEYEPRILHAKTAVIDSGIVICGSTNLDHRSFLHNQEIQAMIFDTGIAGEFTAQFEKDLVECRQLTLDQFMKWPFWKRWLARAAWLFRYML